MTLEEQILQQANTTTDSEGKTGTPWTVDLGGDKLTFDSPEELSANLRQALAQVNAEVTRMKQENEQLRQSQVEDNRYVSEDKESNRSFDMNHFISQMKENPVKAFDYVDSIRYGTENPTQYIKTRLKEAEEIRQENEVQKFLQAHPEFPGGQAAYILNQKREELGMPLTKAGLEAAYNQAIQEQKVPDYRMNQALQTQQQHFLNYLQQNNLPLPQNYQQNNVPVQQQQYVPQQGNYGIPTVARNQPQNQGNSVEQALENMSLEQLESLLRKNGAI